MKKGELWNILYRLVHNEQDRGKLYHYLRGLGNTSKLNTTNNETVVDAINEVNDNIGDLTELETEDKSSIVDAINEVAKSGGNNVSYEPQELTEAQQMQARKNQGLYYEENSVIHQVPKKYINAPIITIAPETYLADTFYNLGVIATDPDFEFETITDTTHYHEFIIRFIIGATVPTTITFPDSVKFPDDVTWEANKIYEINIVNNLATIQSWDYE